MTKYDRNLVWCGMTYVVLGVVIAGLIVLPEVQEKHWSLFLVLGGVALWWGWAGWTLIMRSPLMYFVAGPLVLFSAIVVPIGTFLSAVIILSWYRRWQQRGQEDEADRVEDLFPKGL